MKVIEYENITDNVLLVTRKGDTKIRFYFPEAGKIKGLKGLINMRFRIKPHIIFKYFYWIIRLPFFYWERSITGYKFGIPNLYIWKLK